MIQNSLISFIDVGRFTNSLVLGWSTSSLDGVGQLFNILIMVVFVGLLAYVSLKIMGNAKYARGAKRNLEVLESLGIGPGSFIHLVRAGNDYILVGVTKSQITSLTKVDPADLKLPETGAVIPFDSLMGRLLKKGDPFYKEPKYEQEQHTKKADDKEDKKP